MQGHIHRRVHSTHDGRTTTTWYVIVERPRDKNGKRRQKWHGGFKTRKEAEAARARIVNDINTGAYVEPTKRTLGEYVSDEWLPTMRGRLKATTYDSYSRNLELHVLPSLGGAALHSVTPTKLNALYADLLRNGRRNGRGGGLSERSVSYVHRIVHKALADAVDAQLLPRNPAERARPPRVDRESGEALRSWTPEQLREFLDVSRGDEWSLLWHLAAMTGMRRGELLGLRWSDVDADHRRLSIRRTIVSVAYRIKITSPKGRRARVIDIDPATSDLLRAAARGRQLEDHVFVDQRNMPLHPDRVSKVFATAVRHSGLPRIRFHDLRHTHASIALRAGVPAKVVSERLGHESPAFTLRQYAHVLPGMQAEAAALVAHAVLESDPEMACAPANTNVCS